MSPTELNSTLALASFNNAIGSLTGGGNVTLGAATLTTGNDGTSTAFSGAISGAGGLTKTGGGVLTLSGTSSYLGTTTIDGGVLNVTGSLTSPNVIINSGGTLSGDGTINDPTINAGGILAPGNSTASPGTLTIAGPLTFMPGSFYNVRITPASNDFTSVIGATAINGGIVNVLAIGSGYALSTRYTILTSALGVTGTFTGVTSNLAFLIPSLSYDANDVYLTVKANINFASVALTANQFAVARALSSAARSNLSAPIIAGLENLTAEQARSAFDALSGEGIAAADTTALQANALFTTAMTDQTTLWLDGAPGDGNSVILTEPMPGFLSYAPLVKSANPIVVHDPVFAMRTWHAWASGFGAGEAVHSDASLGAAAQTNAIYGGAMGIDYQLRPDLLIGVAASGSDTYRFVSGLTMRILSQCSHPAFSAI